MSAAPEDRQTAGFVLGADVRTASGPPSEGVGGVSRTAWDSHFELNVSL